MTSHCAGEMRQFQIVTSLAGILSPRPQQCDLGGSVFWQGDDQVPLRTWSQRCHSLFTKLVFKACAGTLIAQVPEAASPQHQLVHTGRSWQSLAANGAGAAAHLPGCAGERKMGSGPALPLVGDGQLSLMCRRSGPLRLWPPVCGVHPSDLSQGLIAPLSAMWGSLSWLPSWIMHGKCTSEGPHARPLPTCPSHWSRVSSCASIFPCSIARHTKEIHPAEIQTMRKSVNKHIFFTVHYLTLASF